MRSNQSGTTRQVGTRQVGEQIVDVGGTDLCVRTDGDPAAPALLLLGTTVLSWDDDLCAALAAGGRFVVRYDLRDTGRSATAVPEAPAYTLRDLVADAAGLLDALGIARAHVAGFGCGGWIAQLLALDHPGRVASLTLVGTRPTAPGPSDPDLPDHAPALMEELFGGSQPDWTDRAEVVEHMARDGRSFAGTGPFDEEAVRAHAGAVFDRARAGAPAGVDPGAVQRANQIASTFAALDSGDRWRERLPGLAAPTLVVHGVDDRFFPPGNGEALAREIPDARLLLLPGTGQELPRRVHDTVREAVLRHTTA